MFERRRSRTDSDTRDVDLFRQDVRLWALAAPSLLRRGPLADIPGRFPGSQLSPSVHVDVRQQLRSEAKRLSGRTLPHIGTGIRRLRSCALVKRLYTAWSSGQRHLLRKLRLRFERFHHRCRHARDTEGLFATRNVPEPLWHRFCIISGGEYYRNTLSDQTIGDRKSRLSAQIDIQDCAVQSTSVAQQTQSCLHIRSGPENDSAEFR